jgi:two-component system, chemotaxis family, sensor histidine kinase and response regulator WspE
MSASFPGDLSLDDLFRMEAEEQLRTLTEALLSVERDPSAAAPLKACMRASHSLKGAARIVGLDAAVRLAHVMEDCFVAAQHQLLTLDPPRISDLLAASDLLGRMSQTTEAVRASWLADNTAAIEECVSRLVITSDAPAAAAVTAPPTPTAPAVASTPATPVAVAMSGSDGSVPAAPKADDRVLRVTADHLNRLLGLASESLVESRWVSPFAASLLRLKRMQRDCGRALDELANGVGAGEPSSLALDRARRLTESCQLYLAERLSELEMYDRRSSHIAQRLYDEALACRMRPFADGVQLFPRMVRDVGQKLGKQVRLDIFGDTTQVDRDVLARLDAPLGHLLRNAVDHAIETPEQRVAAGKPAEGVICLEAMHRAGALQITIDDDGAGIDVARIREAVVARRLLDTEHARSLTDGELLEFLFLPGFTTKASVTEISGRGVGLDVVQDMLKQLRGSVRVTTEIGIGTRFVLTLPITLSVTRTLLTTVGGESYAFPLAGIVRTLTVAKHRLEMLEGRPHFECDGRRIGVVAASQILGIPSATPLSDDLQVIVLGDQHRSYGLIVDRFCGERELVVHPLDPHLGKIKDVAAGAITEDGSPVLILDTDDLIRSVERLVADGALTNVAVGRRGDEIRRKRVLVVDDSLTVRELERKLLTRGGYDVEVAVDGMDGWNAARAGDFDLVVTDVDMPRMDGIELLQLIKADPRLKGRPVMVVSYKDRDEDRRRGLDAGAAYYLTKGSFQDRTFMQAVGDLIGEAAG